MMRYLLFTGILFIGILASGQQSDYILLKKKNNRTLKAYFSGTFMSAKTNGGFEMNGIIKDIRNDSIFVEQQDVHYVEKLGLPALDTSVYTIGIDYREISQFNYLSNTGIGGAPRQRGFAEATLPAIMTIGGVGYIVLESVNTIYRKESFNDKGKLTGMAIAAGIAGSGVLIKKLKNRSSEAGGKFKVVYMKMR